MTDEEYWELKEVFDTKERFVEEFVEYVYSLNQEIDVDYDEFDKRYCTLCKALANYSKTMNKLIEKGETE
jgi:hypothetical protein